MKIPVVMWTQKLARLLVLIGLLAGPLDVRAQEGVEFSPSDAHAVTVHAGNGIELQAKFNGQGPIDLVFDTGSMNVMSASLAKKLGLTIAGTGQLDAGGGSVPAKGAMVDSVQIGGVTFHHQLFAVIESPSGQSSGDFAFVGDQWLQRLAIRIDFDHQQITFYNPRYFNPPSKDPSIPVHFEENSVIGEASLDGIPVLLLIDTGSIRVGALHFSSFTVKQPVAVLLEDTQGSGASHLAGTVGLRILKRFTPLFDCPNGRLYLEPSASYNKPDIFNRAGLVVDPDPEQARIRMVIPHSPAAEAGLETGDVITQIDGAAPTDASLTSAFERPTGTSIHLTVLHSGVVRIVSCHLKDVL